LEVAMASERERKESVQQSPRARLHHLRLVSLHAGASAEEMSAISPESEAAASIASPDRALVGSREQCETEPARDGPASSPVAPAGVLAAASDDELMLMTKGRVRLAFDTLIRRHQDRVAGIARWHTGDRALAVEVAQEAFVDLLQAVPKYQPRGKFEGFLYRIVVNRCRREGRRRRRWRNVGEAAVDELRSDETGFELVLERERERRLSDAIWELSRPLREVVTLWIEGLTDKQIAEALRIAEGTVRSRRFSSIAKLRDILEGV
jgi:RNA polymerase sigma factor (sigma-70 family)